MEYFISFQVFSPLKDARFRGLFIVQLISLLGTGLTSIALALLAFDLSATKASTILGTVLAVKMVAFMLVAPFFAGVSHRLPRQPTLIVLNLLRAVCLAILPWLDSIFLLLVVMFVINALAACFTPMFQALIPDILTDEEDYTRALALTRIVSEAEILISPLLCALLLLLTDYNALFYLNALALVMASGLIQHLSLPPVAEQTGEEGIKRKLFSGFDTFFRTPRLKGLLALHAVEALGGAMVLVNSVSIVREVYQLGETHLAMTMAAFGLGAMLTAVLSPRLLSNASDRFLMLSGGVLITFSLLLGVAVKQWEWLLVLWFMVGVGYSAILTPSSRLIRLSAHSEARHRLFAANFTLSHLAWFFAYVLAGWLLSLVGVSQTFLLLASLSVVAMWVAIKVWPGQEARDLEHSHPPLTHEHTHYHDSHHQHAHEGWEGAEPHSHPHDHKALSHRHFFVIDDHHRRWP